MSRVEDIEDAISRLSPEEYQSLTQWFLEREQARWDRQLDNDSVSGKLDYLFEEADEEDRDRLLREWPPAQ